MKKVMVISAITRWATGLMRDFAAAQPRFHLRDDGRTQTTRNAQVLVDALLPHDGPLFLHYMMASSPPCMILIIGTLTGRNYGWKPEEYQDGPFTSYRLDHPP